MSKKPIYKIIFYNQGKVYEIYARSIHQGEMFSFIEIEQLIFGERSSVVVDPSEENLKSEFCDVSRTYIPLHSIIRIDEVNKKGTSKVTEASSKAGNIMPFPVYSQGHAEDPK
ncbi:MAG: hypothetical protein ACI9XC_000097 [Gammaproteobacteria bacterium]|jgi:hypothetical protein